jgi:hypothetical protein
MRLFVHATALAGFISLCGCHFLTPSGGAAERWANIENARAAKANPKADRICKSMTPIGSIMPQRVCSTQAEWDAFDAETGKTADTFNDLRRSGATEPGREGVQFQAE